MLKKILAITGKNGLFRLVSRGNGMLIVESLVDGKRMPTYARDKIVSLADISMFTTGEDVPLRIVLESLQKKEDSKECALDVKKMDTEDLRAFFAEILPDFDRDRVYPSDIRKLVQWYNILVRAGITDFSEQDTESEEIQLENNNKNEEKVAAQKTEGKVRKAAVNNTRTNVGAKKG